MVPPVQYAVGTFDGEEWTLMPRRGVLLSAVGTVAAVIATETAVGAVSASAAVVSAVDPVEEFGPHFGRAAESGAAIQ